MFVEIYKKRHDVVIDAIKKIDGVNVIKSDGTFYIFPDMNNLIERLDDVSNDIELAEFFLNQAEVAMVPGSAFGSPGCMRISFATSMDNIEMGMERVINSVKR